MVAGQSSAVMDTGYAWVILFACSSIYVVMSGMAKAFGILYTELIKEFDTSAGSTAWIGSVMMFLFFGLGPVSNRLAVRFTFRKVIMVGGFLTSLGHFLSAFVPQMEWMYLTIGVIAGSGCGLVFAPSTTIVSFYFEKRRAMAMGVVLAGAGLGSVVYPYFYRCILDNFGLRTSLIIVSGVLMYVPFVALLLREPAQLTKRADVKRPKRDKSPSIFRTQSNCYLLEFDKNITRLHTNACEAIKYRTQDGNDTIPKIATVSFNQEVPNDNSTIIDTGRDVPHEKKTSEVRHEKDDIERERSFCCSMFDFALFRNPKFTMYVLAFSINILGYGGNFTAFPCYIVEIGYRKDQVAVAMSIIGATEVIARPFFGWFADLKWLSVKNILIFSAVVSGIAAILLPLWDSYELMLVYAVVVGTFPGAFWSLMAVAMLESVTLEQLSKAMGLLSLFMAFGMVLSQPVAGWLKDTTGSWDLSFRIIGMFVSLAGLIVIAEPLFHRVLGRNTSNPSQKHLPRDETITIDESCVGTTFERAVETEHESLDTDREAPSNVNEQTLTGKENVYVIPISEATYL